MKSGVLSVFLMLLLSCPYVHAQSLKAEQHLSPYFSVESAESSRAQFPLLDTRVEVKISGVIAYVKVHQQYVNRGKTPIHGQYVFPASTKAAVHGLKMVVGDKEITAKMQERQAARQLFVAAQGQGKHASLLEQERANVLRMSVANIMPGEHLEVVLSYTELLVPVAGSYTFVYPAVVGPRYTEAGITGQAVQEAWVHNPYLSQGSYASPGFTVRATLIAGMPVKEVQCPSHVAEITYDGPEQATIVMDPEDTDGGNRDYILHYRLAGNTINTGLLFYEGGQEQYFLLMAEPPQRPQVQDLPGREFIFVVDSSGSMSGFPMETAKQLLHDLVGSLQAKDRFNLLLFADQTRSLAPHSLPATSENIRQAQQFINQHQGGGGTNLIAALNQAMHSPAEPGVSRSVLVITDGLVSLEKEAFAAIEHQLDQANLFAFGIGSSVNRLLIEGMAKVGQGEPFVVTDPSEAAGIAQRFRDYVSTPVLTDIQLTSQDFTLYDVEPRAIPDLFSRRPLLIFGKWRGARRGRLTVSGKHGSGTFQQTFQVEQQTAYPENEALRYLWARERIARLSDYNTNWTDPARRGQLIDLSLRYNLLTSYTSFVAVDTTVSNPGGTATTVNQPLPLPQGVSPLAVGYRVTPVPEPEISFLVAIGLLLVALRLRVRHLRRQC